MLCSRKLPDLFQAVYHCWKRLPEEFSTIRSLDRQDLALGVSLPSLTLYIYEWRHNARRWFIKILLRGSGLFSPVWPTPLLLPSHGEPCGLAGCSRQNLVGFFGSGVPCGTCCEHRKPQGLDLGVLGLQRFFLHILYLSTPSDVTLLRPGFSLRSIMTSPASTVSLKDHR